MTSEEVKHDVFSMHPDKAAGLDGLNPAFFQVFWHIIGVDVVEFCQNFMSMGELLEGVNKSLV